MTQSSVKAGQVQDDASNSLLCSNATPAWRQATLRIQGPIVASLALMIELQVYGTRSVYM